MGTPRERAIFTAALESENGTNRCTTSTFSMTFFKILFSGRAKVTPFFSTYPLRNRKLILGTRISSSILGISDSGHTIIRECPRFFKKRIKFSAAIAVPLFSFKGTSQIIAIFIFFPYRES